MKVSQVEELQTKHGEFILDTPLGTGAKDCFVVVDGSTYRNRVEFMIDPTLSAIKKVKWEGV